MQSENKSNQQDRGKINSAEELIISLKDSDNYTVSAPVDVTEIARLLGIKILEKNCNPFSEEDDAFVGKIEFNEGSPVITLNSMENVYTPRRRFTIAHEIGHFCLHRADRAYFRDSSATMSRSASYWDPCESQANSFAAALLMPAALVAAEGTSIISVHRESNSGDQIPAAEFVDLMAKKFVVSRIAMEYRLRNMGVLTGN